ncbi:MAG: hypothetical protein R2854_06995 [Caldilineaceae bacterium]
MAAIPPGYALATFDAGAVTVTRTITAVMPLHTKPATTPVDFAALPMADVRRPGGASARQHRPRGRRC